MSFPKQQASGDSLSATPTPLRNRSLSSHRSNRNPFLNLPIAGRLTLGFLVAALIAAIAAGATGVERVQSLNKEASFYQDLLQTNTDLNTGTIFLQLMSTKLHETLGNATGPNSSQETLIVNQNALQDLATRYNAILTNYVQHNLVDQHPDQLALLTEAGHEEQVPQQHTLAGSAVRTWQVYRAARDQVLQDIIAGNLSEAQTLLRFQAEPTNADALSALRTLIQFEGHLAVSVSEAASIEEQNQLHTTFVATVVACLAIALVGWFISNTIVTRLRQLRRVTQAVEQGELLSRVRVIGRDEIADVSLSVNTMLDTIVGLLQETRSQRDALTNAARHLFSYMQVVSAGELRVNTLASDDPIGMLADAFNFTIGRFRRFVLRAQTAGEQLEVISRQEIVRSDTFVQAWRAHLQGSSASDVFSLPSSSSGRLHGSIGRDVTEGTNTALTAQINRAHEHLLYVAREITHTHIRDVLNLVSQVTHAVTRLRQMTAPTSAHRPGTVSEDRQQAQELLTLEKLLQQLGTKVQVMQTETMKGLSEVDMMINQFLPAEQASNLGSLSSASEANNSDIQVQELSRFAIGFAQDVTTLARQIGVIAQDMRTNVTAFKVEVAEDAARLNLLGATPNQFLAQELPRVPDMNSHPKHV